MLCTSAACVTSEMTVNHHFIPVAYVAKIRHDNYLDIYKNLFYNCYKN